ncbi:unnamed protein product [Effrenium voratum]|uniref:Uncharacterized protein n=1 Tax=Effrenium voratum TaxID=2562239 RepID=A0AA36JFM5_9DINO|nr:unnamed protein product [Effrenium voratum]
MVALAYQVLSYPHLGMGLELGSVYTTAELELRCASPKRREQLHAKLKKPELFKPVALQAALSRKRKVVEDQPKWVRPPKVRGGRKVDEEASRRRRIADHLAGELQREGSVGDEELLLVLKAWAAKENTARKNVMRKGKAKRPVFSDTFGLVRSRQSRQPTLGALSRKYPNMTKLLTAWCRRTLGNFPFTSISVNVNYAAARHRDRNNVGPSAIKAFGRYRGGQLLYWPKDERCGDVKDLPRQECQVLNVDQKPHYFDGTKAHEVRPFKGERFSVVFFTVGMYSAVSASVKDASAKLGFCMPTPESIEAAKATVA